MCINKIIMHYLRTEIPKQSDALWPSKENLFMAREPIYPVKKQARIYDVEDLDPRKKISRRSRIPADSSSKPVGGSMVHVYLSSIQYTYVNPPLAGGGGSYNAPLANFLNNLKTRADIGAKLTVPYSASIWHPQIKFQRNSFRSF